MTYDKNHALLETRIPGLPAPKSGKVRDVFDLGDTLLMVVTDRISAFDVILPCGVPDDVDAYPAALQCAKDDLRGRSMLVKKVNMVEVECIARGYLTGSGWKEYQKSGTVNGQPLRAGYQNASKLDEVLFTPTTKAAIGDHDEAIDYAQTRRSSSRTPRSASTRRRRTTRSGTASSSRTRSSSSARTRTAR